MKNRLFRAEEKTVQGCKTGCCLGLENSLFRDEEQTV